MDEDFNSKLIERFHRVLTKRDAEEGALNIAQALDILLFKLINLTVKCAQPALILKEVLGFRMILSDFADLVERGERND